LVGYRQNRLPNSHADHIPIASQGCRFTPCPAPILGNPRSYRAARCVASGLSRSGSAAKQASNQPTRPIYTLGMIGYCFRDINAAAWTATKQIRENETCKRVPLSTPA
jgi:hypothetical protein